jgi:tetratricopeptide (TPR) repeat protein
VAKKADSRRAAPPASREPPTAPAERRHAAPSRLGAATGLLLGVLVAASLVYAPMLGHRFVTFDDPGFVTRNPHVLPGVTLEGIRWALTTSDFATRAPLTWLSHMLDAQLWGTWAGGHHLTSLVLHLGNVALLYAVLTRMTRRPWPSAAVAALLALHPLHVESVAWVSERKGLLAALFALLTLWCWARWVERPSAARYLLVALAFAAGLAAKAVIQPLPAVLLLLDWWPLDRLHLRASPRGPLAWRPLVRLGLEQLPLLGLAIAATVLALHAQTEAGAVSSTLNLPVGARLANAVVSLVRYVAGMLWPARLAVLYPHPDGPGGTPWAAWQVLGATALVAAASLACLLGAARRPYLLVGWGWFVLMLLPVLGLVQLGAQAMADRYTYLPLVGLYVIVAWGGADLAAGWRRAIVVGVAGAALLALALVARRQVGYWADSRTLYEHAIAVTGENWMMENNLGNVELREGRIPAAVAHYRAAVRIGPADPHPYNNLAWLLATTPDPALRDGGEAVRLAEAACASAGHDDAGFLDTLAAAYAEDGRFDDAVRTAERASRLASAAGNTALAAVIDERAALFRRGRPFRAGADATGRPAAGTR